MDSSSSWRTPSFASTMASKPWPSSSYVDHPDICDHSRLLTVRFQADDARHKMKANMSYEQLSQSYENGQPSRMHRASTAGIPDPKTLKRPFDILLVDDKELRAFANRRDVKLKCEELLQGLVGGSSTSTPLAVENLDLFASSGSVFMQILFISQLLTYF